MQVAKTPTYPVICRFPFYVALLSECTDVIDRQTDRRYNRSISMTCMPSIKCINCYIYYKYRTVCLCHKREERYTERQSRETQLWLVNIKNDASRHFAFSLSLCPERDRIGLAQMRTHHVEKFRECWLTSVSYTHLTLPTILRV